MISIWNHFLNSTKLYFVTIATSFIKRLVCWNMSSAMMSTIKEVSTCSFINGEIGMGYLICRQKCKMKMWVACAKNVKGFEMAISEHQTKSGALRSPGPWEMVGMQEGRRLRAGRWEGDPYAQLFSVAGRNSSTSNAQFRFLWYRRH